MATSTIKGFNLVQVKSGSKNVANDTVTAMDSINTPDTNAYYLIIGSVTPSATVSGRIIVCRLVDGYVRGDFATNGSAQSVILVKGNGGTITLNCNHNAGNTQPISYMLKAIKIT